MFRFTIRDVLWLTVVVGLCLGWWIHAKQYAALEKEHRAVRSRIDHLKSLAEGLAQLKFIEDGKGVQVFFPTGWPKTIPIPKPVVAPAKSTSVTAVEPNP